MSADDTVLVIGFWLNKQKVYMVIRTKAAECFDDYGLFLYTVEMKVKSHDFSFTKNHDTALKIASDMNSRHEAEYGVKEINYFGEIGVSWVKNELALTRKHFTAIDEYYKKYSLLK